MRLFLTTVRELVTLAVAAPLLPVVGLMWLAVAMTSKPISAEAEAAPAAPCDGPIRSRRRPARSARRRPTLHVALPQ